MLLPTRSSPAPIRGAAAPPALAPLRHRAPELPTDLAPDEVTFAWLDARLVRDYDPRVSRAWPGAAPRAWERELAQAARPRRAPADPRQCALDFGAPLEAQLDDATRRTFVADGYTVRPIQGAGAQTTVADFCIAQQHYLVSAGMQGDKFGLYAPDGALVGVAIFAPCSNKRTAAGMRARHIPEDAALTPAERAHTWFGERGYRDCVRLCLADRAPDGRPIGTGAESFCYSGALHYYLAQNRMRWRAERWAECLATRPAWHPDALPPLAPWAAALLTDGGEYVKAVRSFSDTTVHPNATVYRGAGAWDLGLTKQETAYAGRRSGEPAARRSLTKLASAGHGRTHQVLRAVWEGATAGTATATDAAGRVCATHDLAWIRTAVPDGLPPAVRRTALKRAWREAQRTIAATLGVPVAALTWTLAADADGYVSRGVAPKRRYCHWLAARPGWAIALARRCKYTRQQVLAAEAAWYAPARRGTRGDGYNWPKRPRDLGKPEYHIKRGETLPVA